MHEHTLLISTLQHKLERQLLCTFFHRAHSGLTSSQSLNLHTSSIRTYHCCHGHRA